MGLCLALTAAVNNRLFGEETAEPTGRSWKSRVAGRPDFPVPAPGAEHALALEELDRRPRGPGMRRRRNKAGKVNELVARRPSEVRLLNPARGY
ncbi:MAG: hypothetical protein HYZ75_14665 [Elusimicrobia bacterium]|nr:hypothetical protein [Elusimicrobiota bacterium]